MNRWMVDGGLIDLRSDTATKPSKQMLKAIGQADYGDEQLGEDPNVNELCRRVAELLGQQAAIFLPSGTACNLVATMVACRPGDAVLATPDSHIARSERGGAAWIAGTTTLPVQAERGVFSRDALADQVKRGRKRPRPKMVVLENTTNLGGGAIWRPEDIDPVVEFAKEQELHVHIDGARLMNAAIASGHDPERLAAGADSVWIALSKGLGAPCGAVLAGSAAFIEAAWDCKFALGLALRQGILAACGLYALDNNVDRLAIDHEHAALFAERLGAIEGMHVVNPETNIVFFDPTGAGVEASELIKKLEARGVLVGDRSPQIRAVTHLGVTRQQVVKAADAVAQVVKG